MHAFVLNARDRAARAVTFYERGLRRLNDEWTGTGETGDRFRSEHHPYADDLDIFGRGSLFELLSTPRTAAGEATLAGWLLAPSRPEVVRDRQQAVQELQPKLDLREGLFVFGPEVRAVVDTDALSAWAQATPRLTATWPRYRAARARRRVHVADGLVDLVRRAAAVAGRRCWSVQSAVGWWFRAGVREVSEQVERRAQELGVLRDVLALIEREPATTPRLKQLAAELTATGSVPSVEIGRLVRLADLLDSRQNQFFVPIAALLLLGTQTAMAIDHWRARCGSHVPRWLAIAGEYEALAALAGYAAEHPADPFPDIDDGGGPRFEADDLAHPLIPAARAVPNNVRLGGEGPHVLLVSGSNMSGKSTWLRTIGINAVLAQAGAPVRRRAPCGCRALARRRDAAHPGLAAGGAVALLRRDHPAQRDRVPWRGVTPPSRTRRRCCSCWTKCWRAPTRTIAASAPRAS